MHKGIFSIDWRSADIEQLYVINPVFSIDCGWLGDLPPVVVPKFKLEMGASQPRDPGYAQLRQDSWGSQRRLRVLVADTPRHCGA